MDPDYDVIVRDIVSTIGDVKAIILFGSRARSVEEDETADIDLLVVAENLPDSRTRRRHIGIALHELGEHMWRVSPILLTPEELEMNMERELPIMFGICEGYRVLYGEVPKLREFCERVERDYEYQKEWRSWISRRRT
ncbi:MAG: nucleotidyltransferase domain-containing protein [Firmicutes bacterium]|jgi:predicted nucleotidyltransferase|nr:nucleotidyltransferase domain-containing protein [Bacillota bacterium]